MRNKISLLTIIVAFSATIGYVQGQETAEPKPVAWWKFDSQYLRKVKDTAGSVNDSVQGNFKIVKGLEGQALKLDGFTTIIKRPAEKVPDFEGSFTFEAWIAAATYPWNWVPIIAQEDHEEAGFYFGLGPRGQAGLFVSVNGMWKKCETDEKVIELRKWVHVIGVFDEKKGISIYIDGKLSGELIAHGRLNPANTDLIIGMNREKTTQSNPVRDYATLPGWFSFDGIYDEIKIYDEAISPEAANEIFASYYDVGEPYIPERTMPRGPDGPGRFGAYYTKLKYYEEWDQLFRVGDYADVVIQFDDSPIRVVFWRGTRYSPAWVMENGQWMADQSAEYFDTINGCFEHMIDPRCLYSHVRIIENTPARAVVHWRYIPVSVREQFSQVDEISGWMDCVDEYYTFYPDGTGIRNVVQYTSGEPLAPSEAIAFCQPGTSPEDNVHLDAMTLVNLKGESHTYSWANGAPVFKKGENPPDPVIQIINLKSKYKPFMIFEPENNMEVFGIEQRPDASHFPWWNHWPVAQLPSDGRYCQAPDRPSHFSLAWGGPPFHDEAGNIIRARESGSEGDLKFERDEMKTVRKYWSSWLYGASTESTDELAKLARSWATPPELNIDSRGFTSNGYDLTQRAYLVECSDHEAKNLEFELDGSRKSPIVNVCLVISGWNKDNISVEMNGISLENSEDYDYGVIRGIEQDNLIIWLEVGSERKTVFKIN